MANILIIDDSAVMRSLLSEYLSDLGHEVVTASNGIEGIEIGKSHTFDICICDIHMPGSGGREVYLRLSELPLSPRFIFTDSMPDETSEELLLDPLVRYVRKPFELEHIKTLIDKLKQSVGQQS